MMSNYKKLNPGQKIYFTGENAPMELIAKTERFGVAVRSLDFKEDLDLISFEVERGAYLNIESAFEAIKSDPVYSLLDFVEEKRAPSNLIFNAWDFWNKNDCIECLKELETGGHQLSTRHGAELNIDWNKTV